MAEHQGTRFAMRSLIMTSSFSLMIVFDVGGYLWQKPMTFREASVLVTEPRPARRFARRLSSDTGASSAEFSLENVLPSSQNGAGESKRIATLELDECFSALGIDSKKLPFDVKHLVAEHIVYIDVIDPDAIASMFNVSNMKNYDTGEL